tara:strand:+ start:1976 stop:2215 length:240 start_codon:yes stop_codon:yes gene_type:complete
VRRTEEERITLDIKKIGGKNKMGTYRVVGKRSGKPYRSRKTFRSERGALRHGYKLTYNKSGNTKRKRGLSSWSVRKTRC